MAKPVTISVQRAVNSNDVRVYRDLLKEDSGMFKEV